DRGFGFDTDPIGVSGPSLAASSVIGPLRWDFEPQRHGGLPPAFCPLQLFGEDLAEDRLFIFCSRGISGLGAPLVHGSSPSPSVRRHRKGPLFHTPGILFRAHGLALPKI